MSNRFSARVAAVALAMVAGGCDGQGPTGTLPEPTDTDSGEPQILPLDSFPLPQDTAPEVIPDLTPDHWVHLLQAGTWALGNTSAPWGSVTGTLRLREWIDEMDTGVHSGTTDTGMATYECDVRYALTGTEVTNHDCSQCDFVMAVEHQVSEGDPSACHDPDAPVSGAIRNLGYDNQTQKIYFDYYGTGLWLPWYDADRTGQTVRFSWTTQLGIELPDSAQ